MYGPLRKTRLKKHLATSTEIEEFANVNSENCGFSVSMQVHVNTGCLILYLWVKLLKVESTSTEKVLADLAMNEPEAFKAIVDQVK